VVLKAGHRGGKSAPASVDGAIARLAERQHGVVARAQLLEIGLGGAAIDKRAARGRLHRLHRGVYAVGHPVLTARGRWMAAVLACGPGAVLSHLSAAALHGFDRTPGPTSTSRSRPDRRESNRASASAARRR
jgi:predicted transcriptional regulator of viral defense system